MLVQHYIIVRKVLTSIQSTLSQCFVLYMFQTLHTYDPGVEFSFDERIIMSDSKAIVYGFKMFSTLLCVYASMKTDQAIILPMLQE